MANTVIALKKSATPSAAPTNLANGELAINYADGKLYYKAANGTISSINGNEPNYFGTVNANSTLVVADTPGGILTIVSGNNITVVGDAVNDKVTIGLKNDVIIPGRLNVQNDFTHTAGNFYINNGTGAGGSSEGGEIRLANSVSATQILSGPISIDIYENKLRFFETNSPNRGAFINLASASATVGTDLLAPASATDSTARAAASAAFDKANAANVLAFNALPNTTATFNGTLTTVGDILTPNLQFTSQTANITWQSAAVRIYNSANSVTFTNGFITNVQPIRILAGAGTGGLYMARSGGSSILNLGDSANRFSMTTTNWGGIDFTTTGNSNYLSGQGTIRFSGDQNAENAAQTVIQILALGPTANFARFTQGSNGQNTLADSIVFGWDGTITTKGNVISQGTNLLNLGSAAFNKANAANVLAFNALPNTSGASFVGNLYFPSGNVGIGTASPTSNLHVVGTANITTDLIVGSNIYFDNTLTTRIFDPAVNALAIYTASTERLRIDATGNVGIGNSNPIATLHVGGSLFVSQNITSQLDTVGEIAEFAHNANSYTQVHVRNANTGSKASGDLVVTADVGTDSLDFIDLGINNSGFNDPTWTINNAKDGYLYTANGNLAIGTANTTKSVTFFTAGTLAANERLRIDPSGNVGIGTTSPAYKLQVAGSFAAQTKSFVISHPTKLNMMLRYGSLEGPENGVYVRGKLDGHSVIQLPDYWWNLIDANSITVNITPYGRAQDLWVQSVSAYAINLNQPAECFFTVFAERKDVDKLVVEF